MLSDTLKKVDDAEAKAQALIQDAQKQASEIAAAAQTQAKQIEADEAAKAKKAADEAMAAAREAGDASKEQYAAALSQELAAQKAKALEKKDAVVEEIIAALIA